MRIRLLFWMGILLGCSVAGYGQGASTVTRSAAAQPRILVYTKNGVGYLHANIAASVQAFKRIGPEVGFAVDATEDPADFNAKNLKRYVAIVFDNSGNEIFSTDAQRAALKEFVEHGGGVVGLHAALTAESKWPWFAQMMGGRFRFHPAEQDFKVTVSDPQFPVVHGLAPSFTVHDECYFNGLLNPDIHPVLVTDRTALVGLEKAPEPVSTFPNPLPLAWWHTFDGGREFSLALGHESSVYAEPWFDGILGRALVWAADVHPSDRK